MPVWVVTASVVLFGAVALVYAVFAYCGYRALRSVNRARVWLRDPAFPVLGVAWCALMAAAWPAWLWSERGKVFAFREGR